VANDEQMNLSQISQAVLITYTFFIYGYIYIKTLILIKNLFVCRLQESDDGFFEKFGHLLRQKSQLEENVFTTSLAPFIEVEGSVGEKDDDGSCTDSALPAKDEDCIEVDVESLYSVSMADKIREAVLIGAICLNVSKIVYIST